MREREKARIARLKARQDERAAAQKRKEERKFPIPPLQYEHKDQQRPSNIPIKPAMHNSSFSSTTSSANSSKPPSCSSKGKRVSWASSTSSNGYLYQKPLDDKRETKTSSPTKSLPGFQPQKTNLGLLPMARPSIPHLSTSIAARAPRGQELIGAMSQDLTRSWAQSDQQGVH